MQMAEGPKAFLQGYDEMIEMYCDDSARKQYIKELFRSPTRHHFSRAVRFVIRGVCTSSVSPHHAKQLTSPRPCLHYTSFVNAVLTDITESLFSAVKTWIFGSSSISPTLFMSLVRIANGCLKLSLKDYLQDAALTKKRVLKWAKCSPIRYYVLVVVV